MKKFLSPKKVFVDFNEDFVLKLKIYLNKNRAPTPTSPIESYIKQVTPPKLPCGTFH